MAQQQSRIGTSNESSRLNSQDASVAELVKQLTEQTSALARKEVELAKAEMTQKAKRTGIGAGMFGGAGLLAIAAFGALTACIILALNLVLDGWLSALIVGGAYAAVAGGLTVMGKSSMRKGTPPVPQQAVDSSKEDVAWVKDRARSARV